MKKPLILAAALALALLFSGTNLFAQTQDYAPFVSRLKAAVKGPQIKLTWQDAADRDVEYRIYRHTREITPETLHEAALVVRLERGRESYIDSPPRTGEFFYAVIAAQSGPAGKVFDVLIPFRNKTTAAIRVESTLGEEELAAVISKLSARPEQNSIVITFSASRSDRGLTLFRSTSPLLTGEQLTPSREARRLESLETRIVDYPVPGIPYYYALVDTKQLANGSPVLQSGVNTSEEPALITLKEEPQGKANLSPASGAAPTSPLAPASIPAPARPMPLPYYILASQLSGESMKAPAAQHIPLYRSLSPAAEKAAGLILARTQPLLEERTLPVILPQDKGPGTNREEYTLRTILTGAFQEENWNEAEKLFTHFLGMHITGEVRLRAQFYRGQARFFQKKYAESFMDFLLPLEAHYAEASPWIGAVLTNMKRSGSQAEG